MAASTYGSKTVPFKLQVMQQVFKSVGNIAPKLAGYIALELFCTPIKRVSSDFSNTELPAPTQTDIRHKNGFIRAYSWGTGDETALLVHGWESNAQRMVPLVQPLLDAGYRVVAFDGHAHGASSGKQTDLLRYTEALHAVIMNIGEIHTIIGHSFGTGAVMTLLDQYPDVQLQRVVLVAVVNRVGDMMALFAKAVHLPDTAFAAMQQHVTNRLGRDLRTMNGEYVATQFTAPVLIVHDEADRITPVENAKAIAGVWQGADLHITDGLGHRRILKDESVIRKIVDFVSETEPERVPDIQ